MPSVPFHKIWDLVDFLSQHILIRFFNPSCVRVALGHLNLAFCVLIIVLKLYSRTLDTRKTSKTHQASLITLAPDPLHYNRNVPIMSTGVSIVPTQTPEVCVQTMFPGGRS